MVTSRIKYMFLKTAQEDCIIPVTSVCNMNCLFCSHHNNPEGLEVYRSGHLELDFIKEMIDFLPPEGPVIIGESATKIIEGEPFTHPDIMKILKRIRERKPERLIKITTNGSFLKPPILEDLELLLPLELNISLNCSNPDERVFLMSDKSPETVFEALKFLAASPIRYNGSLVAVPGIIGWKSVEKTIKIMDKFKAESIRIFLPGFSKYASRKVKFDVEKTYNNLKKLVRNTAEECRSPLVLEPPLIKDLKCRIKGIVPGSPAERSGIKRNDIITRINRERVNTRVEAFNKIKKARNPSLKIKRLNSKNDNSSLLIKINKNKDEKSGIILDYDLSLEQFDLLTKIIRNNRNKNIAVITSVLAGELIMEVVNKISQNIFKIKEKIDVIVVKNNFFGGSIMSAGLLTVEDIIETLEKTEKKYNLIITPCIIFDIFGNDLTGKNYKLIEEEIGAEAKLI